VEIDNPTRQVFKDMLCKNNFLLAGNVAIYSFHAANGDPEYSALWQRIQSNPGETIYKSIEDGLQRVESSQSVMHVYKGMLNGYFKSNPFHHQRLQLFGRV